MKYKPRNNPNDPAQQIGWDYFDSLGKFRNKTQVYTPEEIVVFMVNSAIPMAYKTFKEQGHNDLDFRALDPTCGGGIFPLFMLRKLDELMSITKKQIVEHCILGVDIDLGGVNATKRTLYYEVGEKCKTKILWGDCLSDYMQRSDHLEHITDLAKLAKHNEQLQQRNLDYMRMQMDGTIPRYHGEWHGWPVWHEGRIYEVVT